MLSRAPCLPKTMAAWTTYLMQGYSSTSLLQWAVNYMSWSPRRTIPLFQKTPSLGPYRGYGNEDCCVNHGSFPLPFSLQLPLSLLCSMHLRLSNSCPKAFKRSPSRQRGAFSTKAQPLCWYLYLSTMAFNNSKLYPCLSPSLPSDFCISRR